MREWINELLAGYLPAETIARVRDDYDTYRDVPLSQLGLDSMATMGLVIRLEERFDKEIDYEAFDIRMLETIDKIRVYLGVGDD